MPPEAGVSFATWMAFTVPLAIINLLLAWLWLSAVGDFKKCYINNPFAFVCLFQRDDKYKTHT